MIDATNLIRLGQIRQQEIVREVENYRLGQALWKSPSLWERLLVRLGTARVRIATPNVREPMATRKVSPAA